MSSTRGRAIRVGGIGGAADAASRVDANNLTRPAYRWTAGMSQPTGTRLHLGHPLLDPSSLAFWRLVVVGLAAAYVVGFHVTLGRTKLGIGPK